MHQLNFEKLTPLFDQGKAAIAIETGTFQGRGARYLSERFARVITIELSEDLHRDAAASLAGVAHVECVQGNSAEQLSRILPTLPADQPVFLFLDAHWSGDHTVDWANSGWKGYRRDTAHLSSGNRPSGPEQCPLLEELQAIMKHCRGPAYVLIDDTRNIPAEGSGKKDFAFQGEDWSHLSRQAVLDIVKTRMQKLELLKNPEQYFISLRAKE